MTTIKGSAAIEYARHHKVAVSKYADPTEGARDDLTIAEAEEVARVDASLLYVSVTDVVRAVEGKVGHDGSGDIGVIVAEALKDDPTATAEDIADIVREARADALA